MNSANLIARQRDGVFLAFPPQPDLLGGVRAAGD